MKNKVTSNVIKGLIIALVLVLLDVASTLGDFKYAKWYSFIPTIILIGAVIWACISYANQMDNHVTFGNVFAHGFKTSAVVACMLFIYTLLAIFVLFPEMKEKALEMALTQLESQGGNMPEDAKEKALQFTDKLFVPIAIAGAVLGTLIVGVIASLIGAAVAKKNPVTPFDNQA